MKTPSSYAITKVKSFYSENKIKPIGGDFAGIIFVVIIYQF